MSPSLDKLTPQITRGHLGNQISYLALYLRPLYLRIEAERMQVRVGMHGLASSKLAIHHSELESFDDENLSKKHTH